MIKKIIFVIIVLSHFAVTFLYADTIHLKNGNKVSGIIAKEDDDNVQIKINIGAIVTFSQEDIKNIERDSGDAHVEMKKSWENEKSEREVADVDTEAKKEKGLVEYEGKWITPEERERLQAASIAGGVKKEEKKRRFSFDDDKEKRSDFATKLLRKGKWFLKETEHFSIFYTDLAQAKIVSDKAEYYFEKIVYDLGYEDRIKWRTKCQVYIVESIDQWKSFLKKIGFNPELVGGFVPNYKEREMFLCVLSDGYLAVTFPHELTHLIFRDIADKSTIPLWLNEGLANYEASVTSISNDLLVKYIKEGTHVLLGDLLRIGTYPEGKKMRELFYAQSEKLVEFLITQQGRKKFRRFCDLILKDRSFKDSLFMAYKGDFEDLEDFNIKLVEYIVK
ncbi:peptidase MA family metallohydrolase [Candidatus Omnitrophota bacterium]